MLEIFHIGCFAVLVACWGTLTYVACEKQWRRWKRRPKRVEPATVLEQIEPGKQEVFVLRRRRRKIKVLPTETPLICVVCLDRQREVAFQCRHFCSCEECAAALKECPLCRARVNTWTRLFV